MAAVVEKCHYCRNDDPYKRKNQQKFWPSYDAASRRSLETEKNTQTVNYYIDRSPMKVEQ